MTSEDLSGAIRHFREAHGGDSLANHVKDVFESRLKEANPEATIERTSYFNHSAIPEFVLTWSGERVPRHVYLRGSYASIVAGSDIGDRRDSDPMFVSLTDDKAFQLGSEVYNRARIADVASSASTVMVTDVDAFSRATSPVAQETPSSPLAGLVRANYVRGGKGLFDVPLVDSLIADTATADGPLLEEAVRDAFMPSAATRLVRAAAIVDMVHLSGEESHQNFVSEAISGRFTSEEVRTLLPWILKNSRHSEVSGFWRSLGSLISLEMLEQEASSLQDADLTHLINANLDVFTAVRAYAGHNVDDSTEERASYWEVRGNTVTRLHGSDAVRLAYLGTRLKSTGNFSRPPWERVRPRLDEHRVKRATISGIEEQITVDSRNGRSILEYLDQVASADATARYFVDQLVVEFDGTGSNDEKRDLQVDFGSRLVVATHEVSISTLLRAVDLLDSMAGLD